MAFGVSIFSGRVVAQNGPIETCGKVDLVMAVDNSGSLSSTEIDELETGVNALIDGLVTTGADINIGSLTFNANQISNLNTLTSSGPTVSFPDAGGVGNTPMPPALDIADQLVNDTGAGARSDALKIVVLLTDGGPNYRNFQYSANGYVAPRDQSADWSAVGGNDTYDNEGTGDSTQGQPGTGTTTVEEMDETALVANSVKSGDTRIVTVYVGDPGNDQDSMSDQAINTYTDLPTYLANNVASPDSARTTDLEDLQNFVDELIQILADLCEDTCVLCEDGDFEFKYEWVEDDEDDDDDEDEYNDDEDDEDEYDDEDDEDEYDDEDDDDDDEDDDEDDEDDEGRGRSHVSDSVFRTDGGDDDDDADDDGTGGCEGSFVIYDDDDNMIAPGAVENLELVSVTCDDDGEPQEACFRTNFCDLHYVVKAGRGTEEVTVSLDDGSIDDNGEFCVTGIEGQNPAGKSVTYAISNIVFTCPPSEE